MSTRNDALLAGIGISCILGALGGIILTRTTLGSLDESVLYWLVYVICVSVVIVPQTKLELKHRLLASLASPAVVIIVLIYKLTVLGTAMFSAFAISKANMPHAMVVLLFFYTASVIAIFIFSFSRQIVLKGLQSFVSIAPSKAKRLEQLLNNVVKVGGTLALIIKAVSQ